MHERHGRIFSYRRSGGASRNHSRETAPSNPGGAGRSPKEFRAMTETLAAVGVELG